MENQENNVKVPLTRAEIAKRYRQRHPKTEEQKQVARDKEKERLANMTPEQRVDHLDKKKKWTAKAIATGQILPYSEWTEEEKERKRQSVLKNYYKDNVIDEKTKEKNRLAQDRYRQNHPTSGMDRHFRSKYGITLEERNEMELNQDGLCAICHRNPDGLKLMGAANLQVDHNHETKQVRGLLCHSCNIGLGKFKDSPELLEAAAEYLKYHNNLALSNTPVNPPLPVESI